MPLLRRNHSSRTSCLLLLDGTLRSPAWLSIYFFVFSLTHIQPGGALLLVPFESDVAGVKALPETLHPFMG